MTDAQILQRREIADAAWKAYMEAAQTDPSLKMVSAHQLRNAISKTIDAALAPSPQPQAEQLKRVGAADAFGPTKNGCCGVTVTERCEHCPHKAEQPAESRPHLEAIANMLREKAALEQPKGKLPLVRGVSRDTESPGQKSVLVAFDRKLSDDELRALHEMLNANVVAEQPAPKVPEGFVLMPRELTAENGAKSALIGEFAETIFVECPECKGYDEDMATCDVCDANGEVPQQVPIEWTTIKAIYRKAVEALAAAPAPASKDAQVAEAIMEIWDAAKAEAAMYVANHCVDGELHAEAILSAKRPTIRAIAAQKGETK